MRHFVLAAAAAILLGGPTVLAFFSGGFFERPRLLAAMVAWGVVVVVALLATRPLPRSRAGRTALAGLFLFASWTALSLTWAPLGGRAQDDLQRVLLYLGFFIAAAALLRAPIMRRLLEPSVVLGALTVVLYPLSERMLPGVIELDRSRTASGRLEQPITYWNGLGAVGAVGLVLALRIAGDPDRPRALRGAAAAAGVPLILGIYLSFSRGALAAVAAGVLVLAVLAPQGRAQLRSALAILGAGTIAALVASRLPTVESLLVGKTGDSGEGLLMLATLVLLSLAAGIACFRAPPARSGARSLVASRPVALSLVFVALVVGAITATVLQGKPQGVSPQRTVGAERLASIDSNRYIYWRVAAETWAEQPLLGVGSGGFLVEWRKQRDRVDESADAHSLYIETAAELGTVGLALLLLFLCGVAAALVRLYRIRPEVATGLAAGLAAWAIHAGLDWNWEMPAVTLPALLLAAAAVAWSEEGPDEADRAGAGSEKGTDAPAELLTVPASPARAR